MIIKNIELANQISLLIKKTISKNKNIENLNDIIKEIKKDSNILECENESSYSILSLSGEIFGLISPNLYHNHYGLLCFFIKIDGDYFHMCFKKETGVIFSIKQFSVEEYNKIYEIKYIKIEKNYVNIVPKSNSFAFSEAYRLNDCLLYSKIRDF